MSIRIRPDQNLSFQDQPEPLLAEQVPERIKEIDRDGEARTLTTELTTFVASDGDPRIETQSAGIRSQLGESFAVTSRLQNPQLGQHSFGPVMEATAIDSLGNRDERIDRPLEVEAFRPAHMALRVVPDDLPEQLRTPQFLASPIERAEVGRGNRATTVFAPENRSVLWSTAYPWSTCGRVDTPLGWGSGVVVGPRHILTVSHVVQWNNDGTTGWLRFQPSYFDGSAPFGDAWGVLTYYKFKVTGPTIDFVEGMFDYVVVVMNNRIGDITGWMGARGYTDGWDGGAYWTHVGYPGDLSGGNRPYWESGIGLDGSWWQFDAHEAMSHLGDVWPGQSGGPFFGWWSGEVGPRAVAVQSSQNPTENNASGGQDLVDLVMQARNDHP